MFPASRRQPIYMGSLALLLLAVRNAADAQSPDELVVPPGETIKISGVLAPQLEDICKLISCPAPPHGEVEKPPASLEGFSFFLPLGSNSMFPAGVFLFRPGDWKLRLLAADGQSPSFPLDLDEFREEHIDRGSGLIGDEAGEGVNLHFQVPPKVWESAQTIELELLLTNLTKGTAREGTFTFKGIGRGDLPRLRLCQGPDEAPGMGFRTQTYHVGGDPDWAYVLVAGDLEGDGDIDLFLSDAETLEIISLINQGRRLSFTTARHPIPEVGDGELLAFGGGDLDGDGDFDLVKSVGDILVLPGLGAAGFGTARIYPSIRGFDVSTFTLADVNDDGHLDLACRLSLYPRVEEIGIFLGDGLGGFREGRSFPVDLDNIISGIAAKDFDGDSLIDIATYSNNPSTENLVMFIGDGRGGFVRRARREDTGLVIRDTTRPLPRVVARDFDADGDADLAISLGYIHYSVLINRGDATFLAPRLVETSRFQSGLDAADLDCDGDEDLANTGSIPEVVNLYLNDGEAFFTPGGQMIYAGTWPMDLTATELDGDGDVDLAISDRDRVYIYENLKIGPPRLSDPRLDVIAQAAPSGPSGLSPTPYEGERERISVAVRPGTRGSATFYIALVSRLPSADPGIQSWSLLASLSDDLEITGVTTSGTAAEDADFTLTHGGELVVPGTGAPLGPGVRSRVFLRFRDPARTLPPTGTATVLRVSVRTRNPLELGESVRGRLTWVDDLLFRQAGALAALGPYHNFAVVAGAEYSFCECRGLDIDFLAIGVIDEERVGPGLSLELAQVDGNALPELCDSIECPKPILLGEVLPVETQGLSLFLPFGPPQIHDSRRARIFYPGDWALEVSDPNDPNPKEPLVRLTDFREEHLELGSEILGDQIGEGVNLFFPLDPKTWSGIADRPLTYRIRNLAGGTEQEFSSRVSRLARGGLPVSRLCAVEDGQSRLDAIIQKNPSAPEGLSSTLYDGEAEEIAVTVPPGEVGEAIFYVALVSQLPADGPGIQGWQLFAGLKGDLELASVTAEGTAAGGAEHFFSAPGELRDVMTGESLGPGFMAAATLRGPMTLPPLGTATVLRVVVRTRGPLQLGEEVRGRIDWADGSQLEHALGRGNAYDNVVTVYSETHLLCTCRGASIVFKSTPIESGRFRRGDANDDGRVDLSDAVSTLNHLFLGSAAPTCRDAADANDDSKVDISDAVRTLNFLFLGAPEPPAPGPFLCADDPTLDQLEPCHQTSCP